MTPIPNILKNNIGLPPSTARPFGAARSLALRLRTGTLGLLSMAMVSASLGGCYTFQASSDYYGLQTANENVVFLVDVSGSMEGKQEGSIQDKATVALAAEAGNTLQSRIGGELGSILKTQLVKQSTKLGAAKRELIPTIRGLNEGQHFSIVTFGNSAESWYPQVTPATPVTKNTAMLRVHQLSADGGTSMMTALERAFQYRGATTIFLMTDGRPTDSSAAQILRRVGELNRGGTVKVNTIGLGPDQDAAFLAALAQQNSGNYINRR